MIRSILLVLKLGILTSWNSIKDAEISRKVKDNKFLSNFYVIKIFISYNSNGEETCYFQSSRNLHRVIDLNFNPILLTHFQYNLWLLHFEMLIVFLKVDW